MLYTSMGHRRRLLMDLCVCVYVCVCRRVCQANTPHTQTFLIVIAIIIILMIIGIISLCLSGLALGRA